MGSGCRKTMSVFCNTYDFTVNKYKRLKKRYCIHGEACLTDNIYSNNINEKLMHSSTAVHITLIMD